jgi:MFS family permease
VNIIIILKSLSREGIIQFLASLATLSVFTYVPYWGRLIGLTDPEIALTATLFGIVAFTSGILAGRLSDLFGARKIFVIIGLFSGSITLFGLVIPHKIEFILFRALSGIGLGIYSPALVALVSDKGDKIGNFSAYGSFGWTVGVLVSGIIGLIWVPAIFIFGALSLLGAAIVAFTVSEEEPSKRYQDSYFSVFWDRKRIYLAFALRHSSAAAIWTFWPLFLLQLGADTFWIAIIQCTNAMTQTIIMYKFTDKMKNQHMVSLGLILSGISFISFTIPTNFIGIIPTQIILGFSWAFLYVGTLRYSIEKSHFDKSTAAGLITSILPVANIIGSLIALLVTSIGGSYFEIIMIAAFVTFITSIGFTFFENKSKNSSSKKI